MERWARRIAPLKVGDTIGVSQTWTTRRRTPRKEVLTPRQQGWMTLASLGADFRPSCPGMPGPSAPEAMVHFAGSRRRLVHTHEARHSGKFGTRRFAIGYCFGRWRSADV